MNLGKFNEEPGQADSWVYVYRDKDLALLAKHPVPEVVHGAGGMGHHDGAFIVVGGLPDSYDENYAYEYDENFRFRRRHVIDSGHTHLGIQTACHLDGRWWFGCYEDSRGLLETDASFKMIGRHDPNYSVGIAPWSDGACLRGVTSRTGDGKHWTGKAVVSRVIRDTPRHEVLPRLLR